MKGEQFLGGKYGNLHTSKEVVRAVDSSSEAIPQKKEAQIGAYMKRIEDVLKREPEGKGYLNGEERLESMIMKDFALDTNDNELILKLAHALYNSEKQVAINRGQANEIQNLEANDSELLARYKDAILEKAKIQKETLHPWLNYIKANDAEYPMWFRYFVLRSLKNMGQFSRDEMSYAKRTTDTIAPFPEMNAEALAFVYTALNKQMEIEGIKSSDVENGKTKQELKKEKTDEYLENVPLGEIKKKELQEELLKRLDGKDFAKLYAFAQVEASGSMSRESLKGEWKIYPQNSNYHFLEESLKGKGTGWCTATGSAEGQLKQGDFYVYYTNNKTGVPTEPRVAIRMAGGQVAEIRGVNPKQELEPELVDIAKEKYTDLPGADKYEKADSDMRMMTSIYKKMFKINEETGEKTYTNAPLSKDELVFIYEINSSIESFGYDKDPRVKEVREKRISTEDAPIIFECSPSQIATNINEVNENTKAYIGEWNNVAVYNKLPDIVDYIYEKFPETKVFKRNIELTTKTPEEYTKIITEENGNKIYSYAQDMLNKIEPLKKNEEIKLVSFTVAQLGYPNGATLEEIYKKADELGLDLCPPQVGPELRINYQDQPNGEYLRIAMNSISGRDGDPRIFSVCHDSGGLWLLSDNGKLAYRWDGDGQFVFSSRK